MGSSTDESGQKWKINAVNAFDHYGKLHSPNGSSDDVLAPVNKCIPIGTALRAPQQTSSRRRVAMIGCLFLLLVAVICLAVVIPISSKNRKTNSGSGGVAETITTLCNTTLYPEVCEETLKSEDGTDPPATESKDLVYKAVKGASFRVSDLKTSATNISFGETDAVVLAAVNDCQELLDDALEMLNETMREMKSWSLESAQEQLDNLVTFMSTALTDHTTCIDGFDDLASNSTVKDKLSKLGTSVSEVLSNALSLVASLTAVGDDLSKWKQLLRERGLLERDERAMGEKGFPTWMGINARRQLASNTYRVNVVVARDGSGKYTDIQKAIDEAPEKSNRLYVIHIKRGIYSGQFEVPKSKTNLVLSGDGIGQTVLTGSRNVQMEGVTTFLSATLIIKGAGFIGTGFTVRNTAGPQKHQAVAMRVSADKAAFWRCSFEAYQDTLYAHSLRQFYSQCTVEGTVDFIFGNAAALFQACNLRPRVPMRGQQNTITAQGRTDPSQNTGLIFHNCSLDGDRDLQRSIRLYPTYLGRPWKQYSRTVFIRSDLGRVMNPEGWLIWSGDWALRTCYYAEYQNKGPGSSIRHRVWWSKQIKSANEVIKYSIPKFIGGNYWLPATKVPFQSTIYS